MATDANIRAVITAKDEASKVINEFGKNVDNSGTSFFKLAGAVAAGQAALQAFEAVGTKVIGFFEDSISTTAELGRQTLKLQRNFGLTAEQGSGLEAVFERFGLTADDASRAFGIFQKHMLDVSDSESIGAKSLTTLGVALKDSTGNFRSMNDVLLDVADKFHDGVVPAAVRAGVAMELFGRSGQNLIPILLKGRDGIAELEAQAKSMGIVLDQQGLQSIQNYLQAQKNLDEAIKGVKIQIGEALMPAITGLIQNHLMPWIESQGGIEKLMREKFIPTLNNAIEWIKKMATETIPNLITKITEWWDKIMTIIHVVEDLARIIYTPIVAWVALDIAVTKAMISIFTSIRDWFNAAWAEVKKVFDGIVGAIGGALSGVYDAVSAPFRRAFDDIKRWAGEVAHVISIINPFDGGKPAPSNSVPKGGIPSKPSNKIPGFNAGGTDFWQGGPTWVGEKGPELLNLPTGSQIIPNNKASSGSTVNVSFSGIFTGSEMEFRKLATKVFQAGADVAGMQNNDITAMTTQQWRRA